MNEIVMTTGSKLVLQFGTLIDGIRDEASHGGSIFIEDGRIIKLERKWGTYKADATHIDASDCTVMPGLIDCHVHLSSAASGPRLNPETWELKTSSVMKVLNAVANCRRTIEGGFTTVRNMGHQWEGDPVWDASLRDAVDQDLVPGPRILASANIIGMTASHGDTFLPPFYPVRPIRIADGVNECRLAVRENIRAGADFIKIMASGGGVLGGGDRPEWRNYTVDEIRAIVDEAHSFGKKVAAHAVGLRGIRNSIEAGVDTIEHGYFIDEDALVLMVKKKIALVPTLTAIHAMLLTGKGRGIPEHSIESVRLLKRNYVKSLKFASRIGLMMPVGTDIAGTWALHGKNAQELSFRVKLVGGSPMSAIKSATSIAASVLGLTDAGAISPGNRADLIVVKHNPLLNITVLDDPGNILIVIKDGKIVVDRRREVL